HKKSEKHYLLSVRTPSGYSLADVEKKFESQKKIDEKKRLYYAQVSPEKKKEDLDRQCKYLRQKFPDHEFIRDIGSGFNWKRKDFISILEQAY
ncbi:20462_t:CDS:1, partial [Gigaspora rosea]